MAAVAAEEVVAVEADLAAAETEEGLTRVTREVVPRRRTSSRKIFSWINGSTFGIFLSKREFFCSAIFPWSWPSRTLSSTSVAVTETSSELEYSRINSMSVSSSKVSLIQVEDFSLKDICRFFIYFSNLFLAMVEFTSATCAMISRDHLDGVSIAGQKLVVSFSRCDTIRVEGGQPLTKDFTGT